VNPIVGQLNFFIVCPEESQSLIGSLVGNIDFQKTPQNT